MKLKICLIAGIIAIAAVSGILESLANPRPVGSKEEDATSSEKGAMPRDSEAAA